MIFDYVIYFWQLWTKRSHQISNQDYMQDDPSICCSDKSNIELFDWCVRASVIMVTVHPPSLVAIHKVKYFHSVIIILFLKTYYVKFCWFQCFQAHQSILETFLKFVRERTSAMFEFNKLVSFWRCFIAISWSDYEAHS